MFGQSPQSSLFASVPHSETLARVTSAAIFEIQITAEGSLAVMTGRAGVISAGKVFQSPRRTDLAFLRQSRRIAMTIRARKTLSAAVLRMTKTDPEGDAVACSFAKGFLLVTDAARCQVASTGLRVGRVATVALLMRREIGRN